MGIPPHQYIQGMLNQRFVGPNQLDGRGVQREASGVLFLVVHGDGDFAPNPPDATGVMFSGVGDPMSHKDWLLTYTLSNYSLQTRH